MSKYKVRNTKEMWLWLEGELASMHILLYVIIGILVNHWIGWVICGAFILGNLIFSAGKLALLSEENKND